MTLSLAKKAELVLYYYLEKILCNCLENQHVDTKSQYKQDYK